ncbi:MAG: hypothetical protein ACW98Y_07745 [Candidatus Thorarchaeota archaeon]|jgi:hypothetical protein
MGWKLLVAVWIISILSIWIVGSLVGALFATEIQGSQIPAVELIMNNLTNPEYILIFIVLGSILTPCCYCYGKASE